MENVFKGQTPRPFVEQIARLVQQIKATQELLATNSEAIPSSVVEQLVDLSRLANQIDRQISRYESGHENLRAIAGISQLINSSLDLNEVLRIVMDTIIRLTGAERGFLMLRDEAGEMTMRIARNWEQESINPSEFAISRTIMQQVISEGEPVLTTNAQADPRFGDQKSIVAYNLRSILCVPLKVKEELIGVMYADNRLRSGLFTVSQRDLLSAFANQAAIAIENASLFESVRKTLAEVSALKGLMDNVFTSIISGVITTDCDNHITLCNQAAAAILGMKEQEIIGQSLAAFLLAEKLKLTSLVWQTDKNFIDIEIKTLLPERGPVTLSINLSPLKDTAHVTQGIAIVMEDLTEKKHLEGQRSLFERMVSPAVIDQLDPDQLHLGGRRTVITTLFADIRGFTYFSEGLPPEELVGVLNRYLAVAAEAILDQQGTIDKFHGDSVMAWFNAPVPQVDHTLRAVQAAIEIQKAVKKVQQDLPEKYRLSFGIGIHCGDALLGLVGTEKRLEYTAIGDSVNTAKRIQESAGAGQILVSAEAYHWVSGQVFASPVEAVQAKGKREPIQVFEIAGLKSAG
jgi:PAS domain S-box-containing protein